MLGEKEMKSRIASARKAGVPVVNYGIAIAQMNGIILTEPEGPRYDPAFKEQFVKDLEEIVAKRTVQ